MAGRIRASDIEEVKRRINLADLVGDYVALKPGGIDSMKGLCPFHDERSPSFHVRPSLGYYHCFGCGESGDALTFLQRHDHLSFAESVERIAAKVGFALTYEENGERRDEGPNRARLYAANQAAAEFFATQLQTEEGAQARDFLTERGFGTHACATFGVGYAPRGWDGLTKELTRLGFASAELLAAGLLSEGQRGAYDRFRGRIVWPIRDASGQVVGFGARKLYEDDNGPKYLNTPETAIYHKSRVLYGLDLAKRTISRTKRVIVVEGYTDVMACHLAGEEAVVATCGTAFGREHISVLRRMMGDDAAAEVIFTFDPDDAGQKAALRAFSDEKLFSAQTYVAVAPEGLDPADLRLTHGDEAVRALFTQKVPLFEFALRQSITRFNLNTVEGRVSALRAATPIVVGIKDPALRPGYTRELARMLGTELSEVQAAIRRFKPVTQQSRHSAKPLPEIHAPDFSGAPGGTDVSRIITRPSLAKLRNTPVTRLERDALMVMVQQGPAVGVELMSQAITADISDPDLRVVRDAVAHALPALHTDQWFTQVVHFTPATHNDLARELALAPLPHKNVKQLDVYARGVIIGLLDYDLRQLKNELVVRMQRIGDPLSEDSRRIQQQLANLENARRSLREE